MGKARGLGRGLRTLIPPEPEGTEEKAGEGDGPYRMLRLDSIVPSPWQPRKTFDQAELDGLAATIREKGLLQPLLVRPSPKGDGYEVAAGERRLRALKSLGWEEAPAVVRNISDAEMRELALVENLQRADLNPMEVAAAYQALASDSGMSHDAIAKRVGVSRPQVTNMISLLELPGEVRSLVAGGELSFGAARAIHALPDPLAQIRAAKRVVDEGLSVRDVEDLARGGRPRTGGRKKAPDKPEPDKPAHVADLEDRLRRHFGTKVEVDDRGGKGRITLEYYSVGDAQRLLLRMGLPEE